MQRFLTLILVVLSLAACERTTVLDQGIVERRFPTHPDLDVLFVIDNSLSTYDKQALFAANFPRLVDRLDAAPGGRPNLHIAIVSTTVGTGSDAVNSGSCLKVAPDDDGLFVSTPRVDSGCVGPAGHYFVDISDGMGGRTTNYQGLLPEAFSCLAQVGTTGCGFEAPLEAMKRALDGSHPENAGFVRPDADLAVVILTDEDDCSVADPALFSLDLGSPDANASDWRCQPLYAYDCDQAIAATTPGDYTHCKPRHGSYLRDPSEYVDFLKTLKDPSQLLVALIAGDPTSTIHTGAITSPISQALALEPSCQATIEGNLAIARPALRLDEFRRGFGDRGVFATVCQSDYSGALAQIGDSMTAMMGTCLPAGVNPEHPQCTIVERTELGTPGQTDVLIPACSSSNDGVKPCFRYVPGETCSGSGLALEIDRDTPAPEGSVIVATCNTN